MPDSRDLLNKLNVCESEIEKLFLLAAYERIDGLVPQYQVLNYRIDFAIPDKMIAIEIDGHDYHKTKEQRTHDNQREREIKLALPATWTIIRFTGSEIFRNAALCVDEVLQFINKNSTCNKSLKDNVCALFYRCIPLSLIQEARLCYQPTCSKKRDLNGAFLFDQGKYDEAIQAFNKALEIDPKNADAWTGKGQALIKQGKHNEALLALKTSVEIDPQNTNNIVWCLIGESQYECGNYDEALQALDKALEIDPQSPAGLTKSEILSNPSYWAEKALKLWDYNAFYPFDTSTINKENYEEAIKCYNNAIKLDPLNAAWYYGKARIYTALSFYARDLHNDEEFDHCYFKTLETYKKAAEIDSLDPRFWIEIGEFLIQLEKYEEASNAFDKAIEVNQGKEWFHLYIWNGKLSALNGIARQHPHNADIWYTIGDAWIKRGPDCLSMYNAILAYDKAIINRPNFVEAWNNKSLALKQWSNGQWRDESSIKAAFAMAQGKYDEAIKSYEECIRLNPNYASAGMTRVLLSRTKATILKPSSTSKRPLS